MTLLHEAVEQKKFDIRMLDRNLVRGLVSDDEAKVNLASLPDDADLADYIAIESFWDDSTNADA